MFTVRGSPQQIDYARQLVEEKIGVKHYYFIFYGYGVSTPPFFQLVTDLVMFVLSGTCHSHGWPTWPPWATWRPRTTWTPWTTWSPWCPYGSIQPWTIQPGTSRTTVSTVAVWSNVYLNTDVVECQWYIISDLLNYYYLNQWSPCTLPAAGLGQWLPTLAAGTAWSKWVPAVCWGENKSHLLSSCNTNILLLLQ